MLGLVVGGAAALGWVLVVPPQYTSTVQFFVSTTGSTSAAEVFQGGQFSQERVESYAQLLRGDQLAAVVVDRLDLEETPEELLGRIEVTALPETVLIEVAVTDGSATRAQRIAEVLGDAFTDQVSRLERRSTSGEDLVAVIVTDTADLPSAPSSPKTVRDIGIGLLAGLVLGCVLAVIRARTDRSVRDPDDARELAEAPVVGLVLKDDTLEKRHVVDRESDGQAAEGFRQLRTNLQFLDVDEPPRVIMITSPSPAEGKTTLVVNLALALADAGRRVAVVEADLRRPKVSRYLGLVSGAGLTNVLAGSAGLEDVLQQYGDGKLTVLAAGPTPPNPGEVLGSSQMAGLLDQLRDTNDIVLVDAAPVLPVADTSGLAVMMDAVLLSVRYGVTRKRQLRAAAIVLDNVGAKTLGVVLNVVPRNAPVAADYGQGYNYAYGSDR
ncbi:Chain length determinant protein [Trujillonella endophytica]|uniref:Chain length determinant protein n=1 Tax=Trujillonella endophytica TaxID=673521 RepID=A0A1H8W6U9_9ACTN|nr:Chain length determinant protein [Trujillella endophytica]